MLNIREEQKAELVKVRAAEARRTFVASLRQRGLHVDEDPQNGDLLVTDRAGGRARISSIPDGVAVTSGENRTHQFHVDEGGRLIGITDPAGAQVGFEYDAKGRLVAISRGRGRTHRFEVDEGGCVTAIHFPDHTSAQFAHDTAVRVTTAVDRNGRVARYTYSETGQLTQLRDWEGNVTSYAYGGPKVPTSVVSPNGTKRQWVQEPGEKKWTLLINGVDHLTLGAAAQPDTYEVACADGTWAHYVTRNGRTIEAVNEVCAVKFEYDDKGRVLKEETDGQTVEYLRNEVGALVGITAPGGLKLEFRRDAEQRVSQIVDWNGSQFSIDYAISGALKRIAYPNGLAAEFTSNSIGLTESMRLESAKAGRLIGEYSWQYDVCDRLAATNSNGEQVTYKYDAEGRLIGENSEVYQLDGNGNRVRDSAGPSSFDAANQIVTWADQIFQHDARGNLVAGVCPKGYAQFTYDGLDRLVAVRVGRSEGRYFYDALGRRVRKEVDGAVTRYLWAGEQLLSETTTKDGRASRRDFLHSPILNGPLAMRTDGDTWYLHPGRRAEPLCMTGSDGELLWGASYTAFGQARVHLAKESQPWRLSGQYCDEETGLCYMMARFCNPELGRFLTPDPWGVKGGSLNFYSYCDGDPLNKIDPTGDFVFLVIAAAVVIGAAVGAGVEAYKQHKQHPDQPLDWGEIGKEAAIGAAVGAVAAGVGLLLAPVGTAVAAGIGGLGGAMVGGGLVGGAVGGVQQCASNALHHAPLLQGVGTAMGVGAAIGTVTAGVGSLWANRAASAAEEADPALLQRYLTESGGRWGGTQTRLLNHQLASNLEDEGFTITGGAGRASEEWIPGPGGGTKGGTFVDITATNGENTIRVQTVSTLTDGVTPTPAEAAAAERINAAFPNDELRLVPKK